MVIGNAGRFVNRASHAMSAQFAHHLEAAAVCLPLDGAPDVEDAVAGRRLLRRLPEAALGAAHQFARGVAGTPRAHRGGGHRGRAQRVPLVRSVGSWPLCSGAGSWRNITGAHGFDRGVLFTLADDDALITERV